jgi:chromosomal replication initiation ATPase DnaA
MEGTVMLQHKRRETILPPGLTLYSWQAEDAPVMIEVVRAWYRLPADFIMYRTRVSRYVEARQTALYMLTIIEELPMHEIGKMVGYTDHGIVVHSRNAVEQRIQLYPDWDNRIRQIYDAAAIQCGRTMINNYEYIYYKT